jgi:L-ribulose-5-phosphate 3-epimerase
MSYRIGLYEKAMPNRLNLEEKLSCVKQAGFDFVELSIDETPEKLARIDWTEAECRDISNAIARTGIPFGSICLSGQRKYPLGSTNPKIQAKSIEILKKTIMIASWLGARIIQLAGYDVYYEPGTEQTREDFLQNLKICTEYAACYGVLLGFETMETPFMDTVEKAMLYVRKVNSPYLGVYPDLGNLTNSAAIYKKCVTEDLKTGQGHLIAMHLKETVPGKYRDMRFGEGKVDFLSGIKAARALGVRLFVTEAWDQGESDWFEQICRIREFAHMALEEVFADVEVSPL